MMKAGANKGDKKWIIKLNDAGMSLERISATTRVPLDHVTAILNIEEVIEEAIIEAMEDTPEEE